MKTNLDALFKTNKEMEIEGNWFEVSPGVKFKMKRFGGHNSDKLKPVYAVHYKPYARQIDMGTMDPVKEREIMTTIFIKSCIVDWDGVEIDGEKVPYSFEAALKLLMKLPDLSDTLTKYASDSVNFREEVGNS